MFILFRNFVAISVFVLCLFGHSLQSLPTYSQVLKSDSKSDNIALPNSPYLCPKSGCIYPIYTTDRLCLVTCEGPFFGVETKTLQYTRVTTHVVAIVTVLYAIYLFIRYCLGQNILKIDSISLRRFFSRFSILLLHLVIIGIFWYIINQNLFVVFGFFKLPVYEPSSLIGK
jgi:hypothetical protein